MVQKKLLTIMDFSLSANKRRLCIIDQEKQQILEHSLLVFGPALTEQRFMDELSSRHKALSSKTGSMEKVDSMTKGIAWG